ncbi:MAG: hypothetical protein IIA70_04565 [Proteobacteria bacterium]|nr:hypothetical protein [Pseudomonadota bacterium]
MEILIPVLKILGIIVVVFFLLHELPLEDKRKAFENYRKNILEMLET